MNRQRPTADAPSRAGRRCAAAALLAALAACSAPGEDQRDPAAAAALGLFQLARAGEPEDERLAATFDPLPDDENDRAALLDALAALAEVPAPRVTGTQRPAGPDDVFVDLEAALVGGGLAAFTVRLRGTPAEGWRVRWFQGPGVEWPAAGRVRGEGLSSSAPPETRR